jgi:hypothetical protein
VWHVDVTGIIHRNVFFPAPKCLTDVQTGLGNHDTVKVIIFPLKSLAQTIPAKRAKHAAVDVRFDQAGRLVLPQNPHRQYIRSVEYLQRHISAEVAGDLPTGPLLPLPGIVMPLIHPFLEIQWHFFSTS